MSQEEEFFVEDEGLDQQTTTVTPPVPELTAGLL
jgi:hypothetical protein